MRNRKLKSEYKIKETINATYHMKDITKKAIKNTLIKEMLSGARESNRPNVSNIIDDMSNIINETKLGPHLPHAPHPTWESMTYYYNTPLIKGRFRNSFKLA